MLAELIDQQDWSDRPDYRGAVAMHPTALSLVFFGVPSLLGALAEAGLGGSAVMDRPNIILDYDRPTAL